MYSLPFVEVSMTLCNEKIKKLLKNPIDVYVYEEVDSTNNEAKRRIKPMRGKIALFVTDHQTAGRGRRGHVFYSPKGTGLYMTLALPLTAVSESIQKITCAAAVAVCEAISLLTDKTPSVKWVNDIYADGRKVGGILAELVTDDDNAPVSVIVGIGLNLCTDFPDELKDMAGNIGDIEPNALCAAIADKLTDLCRELNDSSFIEKYITLNFCLGQKIRYTDRNGTHTATAVTIDHDGALIVEENGIRRALSSGEISIKM